jgi:hypothetical protein
MSTTKYISWGQVKEAEREKQVRSADEPAVDAAPTTVAPDATVAPQTTVARDATVARRTIAPRATVAQDDIAPWHGATVAPRATVAPSATVKPVSGYWQMPHTVTDSLWEILDPYQAKVYVRLLRLSRGHRRETCRVGYDRLATGCKLSKRKIQDVVGQLETLGLLERVETSYGQKGAPEKGTLYRVIVPGETEMPGATGAPAATVAPRATVARGASMKDKDLNIVLESDVYEIRTIAARLFEAHRTDPGFTHERLREIVRDALIGQGRSPDERALDEAIHGMTP